MKFGLIPDAPDPRDFPIERLLGAATPPTDAVHFLSYEEVLDSVLKQQAENCVGCFVSNAVYVQAQIAKTPVTRPSAMGAYTLGRMLANADLGMKGAPLVDNGSSARYVLQAAARYGLVSMERWPEDAKLATEPVPLDVVGAASDAKVRTYYSVDGAPVQVLNHFIRALMLGYIPGFGGPVDQRYLDLTGEYWAGCDPRDKVGYHQQTIIGFDMRRGCFLVLNSWGKEWAQRGLCWVPFAFVTGEHCFSRFVLQSGPAESPH